MACLVKGSGIKALKYNDKNIKEYLLTLILSMDREQSTRELSIVAM